MISTKKCLYEGTTHWQKVCTKLDFVQSFLCRCKAMQDSLLTGDASVSVCVCGWECVCVWKVKTPPLCIKLVSRCKAMQDPLCDTRKYVRRLESVCVCVCVCVASLFRTYFRCKGRQEFLLTWNSFLCRIR